MRRPRQQGFTIIELLVAIAVTMIVLAVVMMIYQRSVQVSGMVTTRAELQSELRAASDQIARDLNQAGTGIPIGGIPIPRAASGGADPRFWGGSGTCYFTAGNSLQTGVLYKVVPGNAIGPTTTETTDGIVVAYVEAVAVDPTDPNASGTAPNWSNYTTQTIADDGSSLTMPAGTTPKINDPAYGLVVGDLLMLQNSTGTALGVVTNYDGTNNTIAFATNDPLNINHPIAPVGNIAALKYTPVPTTGPKYPPTKVSPIMMVTYFIQAVTNSLGTDYRLMRQVDA